MAKQRLSLVLSSNYFPRGQISVRSQLHISLTSEESLIAAFFRESEGKWRSERRYYTLPEGETKEMVSIITIRFLQSGSEELDELAQLHGLSGEVLLTCGAKVSWESTDSVTERKQSEGSTVFGALGKILYRDRGFATSKPVTAEYYFTNPKTLCLRTEYNGSVFEEELKLIGTNYRTRQSIISRAGEQLMIGQYLEKRIH
ncbi:phycobiliprotein lyase [Planktothrix sp. FACHB-1355]|uniref:Chromophore lyase CpcS/CpeS n=1 Tax=Aerosakkonema funiforme FACHB-1375 TaxID=2949571 RepID=A0A926ZKN9_9CYAN|nr:phycobiliprotein lyase [Aerosakkonema funiforme FACHB-1375]MBD3560603.1 phycobiliprotein lyase [Planktothrix sp. FACHB-1355]